MVGIGIAVVVIGAILFFLNSGGSGDQSSGSSKEASKPAATPKTETPAAKSPALSNEQGVAGKPPKTPAPTIAASDLERAESEYQSSLGKWTEAERARQGGDHDKFKTALTDASVAMERSRVAIERYTDWLDEAVLSDWAIPGEYVALQKRMEAWARHFAKIKKAKPRD